MYVARNTAVQRKKIKQAATKCRYATKPASKPPEITQNTQTLLAGRRNLTSFAIKIVGIEGETLDKVVNLAHDYAVNWRKDKLTQKENIKAIFELAK